LARVLGFFLGRGQVKKNSFVVGQRRYFIENASPRQSVWGGESASIGGGGMILLRYTAEWPFLSFQ
jgi:hypothetical protein